MSAEPNLKGGFGVALLLGAGGAFFAGHYLLMVLFAIGSWALFRAQTQDDDLLQFDQDNEREMEKRRREERARAAFRTRIDECVDQYEASEITIGECHDKLRALADELVVVGPGHPTISANLWFQPASTTSVNDLMTAILVLDLPFAALDWIPFDDLADHEPLQAAVEAEINAALARSETFSMAAVLDRAATQFNQAIG